MSNQTSRPTREIQQFLIDQGFDLGPWGADGIWGNATMRAVMAWQERVWLDVDGIWGIACDGLAFPPGGSIHGIDYSFARPDPAMLASRGIRHAGRYLWPNTKGITRGEHASLVEHGIAVWFIYEADGRELLGGYDAGVDRAQKAEALLHELGLSGYPIYVNVDFDAQPHQFPVILDALRGVNSVIGLERTGLYAGINPLRAAFDAGVIAWGFQTYAWSRGQWDERAQLQQWANGQWGGSVDFTRAMVPEFGQHPVTPPPPPTVEVPRADITAMRDAMTAWLDDTGV